MKIPRVLLLMLTNFVQSFCIGDSVTTTFYICNSLSSTPNYENEIINIVDNKCTSSPGYHLKDSIYGDYTSLQGMKEELAKKIKNRVLFIKNMPESDSPRLTQKEPTQFPC